jgi:HKD family nuclease
MFYNQPLAHRFGTALANDIEGAKWDRLELAVAWVRRSGTKHLESSFKAFLRAGGFAQVTVGVDIENTSEEGLRDLLNWQSEGAIETHVYHNEAETTFHPKVYLLRNEAEARLIVGSNNLTEAGLFANTEAGLQLDSSANHELIQDVRSALAAWRDTTTGFARRLDATLLNDLVSLGYVFPERELRDRRKASTGRSKKKRRMSLHRLFKAQRIIIPPVKRNKTASVLVPGTILLLRARRASKTARRTQIQLPIRKMHTDFFTLVDELVSAHDARSHRLVHARARGVLNTIKVEIPEIEPMEDPVLRLERTPRAIIYQAFDANSVLGVPIRQALLNGFAMTPPTTFKTVSDESRATWWRFI